MLKKILIGLAVLVLGFVVVVAMQPSEFQRRAQRHDRRASGGRVRSGQRPAQMGRVVAVGEARSGRQDQLRGA